MITARRTKEQERDLFAVPGNLGEANSVGPNSLIRDGALAVTNARDILKEYQALYSDKINPKLHLTKLKYCGILLKDMCNRCLRGAVLN